jgi:hypothetical protein
MLVEQVNQQPKGVGGVPTIGHPGEGLGTVLSSLAT